MRHCVCVFLQFRPFCFWLASACAFVWDLEKWHYFPEKVFSAPHTPSYTHAHRSRKAGGAGRFAHKVSNGRAA